ncbi:MAG: SRPBCC domain-containing protein [Pseudomonadota bacterium]
MDAIFKALSDDTRRLLLDELHQKDGQSLSDLETTMEKHVSMTRFGIMKHLKILEEASLVVSRKSGRFKHHYLNAVPLQEVIDRWIEPLTQKPLARMALSLKADLESDMMIEIEPEKPDFVLETYIRANPQKVWDALTTSEHMQKYHFFHCSLTGEAKKGARLTHHWPSQTDGRGGVMLDGKVLEADPPKRLEMTFEPHWNEDMKHSRIAYELEDKSSDAAGMATKLTILHFGIPEGQEGVRNGWAEFASSLKSYLETGEALIVPQTMPQGATSEFAAGGEGGAS